MHKVFEDFNFVEVGRLQSLLEAHGIPTFLRNEFGASVLGELPFVEVIPQLYILRAEDLDAALELLRDDGALQAADESG